MSHCHVLILHLTQSCNVWGQTPCSAVWFVDPNGEDTLVMHRKLLYKKFGVNVYKVTFSLIVNNVEKAVGGVMYMGLNSVKRQVPSDRLVQLNPSQQFGDGKSYDIDETIYVVFTYMKGGKPAANIFIHPNNTPIGNQGCITLSETEPRENSGHLVFDATGPAIIKVNELFKTANGGENGELLSGDEFLLSSATEAPERSAFPQKQEPLMSAANGEKSVEEVLRNTELQIEN